jgi:hypothetical protein
VTRAVRRLFFTLLLVALAGCSLGDGDDASITRSELEQLVLQPDDLPRVFVRFDEGRQISADSPGGRRADRSRFDRIEGWKARYQRPGTPTTAGPLVIVSRVDLFESADGAQQDLEAARADLSDRAAGWKAIDEPGLGDESFAATFVQEGPRPVRYYEVFWRDGNATAALDVSGFEGKLALADGLELARAQQRRIARAVDS